MGKFKAARGKSSKQSTARGAFPCVIIILCSIALVGLLFYSILKSS